MLVSEPTLILLLYIESGERGRVFSPFNEFSCPLLLKLKKLFPSLN